MRVTPFKKKWNGMQDEQKKGSFQKRLMVIFGSLKSMSRKQEKDKEKVHKEKKNER
jgi:hypothetical protein